MRIVVGSTNPVKIYAVREVFAEYFPGSEVVGVAVATGVSEQPISEAETIAGAKNRALAALNSDPASEYGVGLEGGVTEVDGELFECAWAAIITKNLKLKNQNQNEKLKNYEIGLGGGLYFEIPPKVAARIRAGEELGPIMEELMRYDVKRNEGAIGVLTKGKLTRQAAYEQIVKSALVRFVSPEWFG